MQLASRPQVYSGTGKAIPTLQCMFKTPSRLVGTVAHDLVSLNNFHIKYRNGFRQNSCGNDIESIVISYDWPLSADAFTNAVVCCQLPDMSFFFMPLRNGISNKINLECVMRINFFYVTFHYFVRLLFLGLFFY